MARPTKYKPEYDRQVFVAAKEGMTDAKIGELFGVTEQTINNWKLEHESFFESLKKGKDIFDTNEIEASLAKRAKGFEYIEEMEEVDSTGGKKTRITKKFVAPETAACIFWLKNRNPSRWRDKQEIDTNTQINVISGVPRD